jgi:hypothetical protein
MQAMPSELGSGLRIEAVPNPFAVGADRIWIGGIVPLHDGLDRCAPHIIGLYGHRSG